MTGLIEGYLDELARRLSFDPGLAERICEEIAGHVEDALESRVQPTDADIRAVLVRLGAPRTIAARFLADTLERQSERLWWTLLTMMAATFLAMRLRSLGLAEPLEGSGSLTALIPLVDRYGLVAAMIIGPTGWLAARWLKADDDPARGALRRPMLVVAAAGLSLAALAMSVAAGATRIWLQGPGDLPSVLILAGLAGEVAVLTLGGWFITTMLRRMLTARALAGA